MRYTNHQHPYRSMLGLNSNGSLLICVTLCVPMLCGLWNGNTSAFHAKYSFYVTCLFISDRIENQLKNSKLFEICCTMGYTKMTNPTGRQAWVGWHRPNNDLLECFGLVYLATTFTFISTIVIINFPAQRAPKP
jgi:hypothetical protein